MALSFEQYKELRLKGATPEQIKAQADSAPETPVATEPPRGLVQGPARTAVRMGTRSLPAIGGAVGGALGGTAGAAAGGIGAIPGGMGGAALGGSGGRLLEMLANEILLGDDVPDPLEGAIDLGGEGIIQGLLGGGGSVGSNVMARSGEGIAARALGAPKSLTRSFGKQTMKQAAREAPIIGEAGTQAAVAGRRAAAKEAKDLAVQAERSGVRLNIEDIAKTALGLEEQAAGRALSNAERDAVVAKVQERAQQMLGKERFGTTVNVGRKLKPTQARRLTSIAQKSAKGARAAQAQGQPVLDDARLDDAVAKGVRQAMNDAVKGYGEAQAKTKGAIALQRAMQEAELLPDRVRVGGRIGPVESAVIPAMNVSRTTAQRLGRGMSSQPAQRFVQQAPRLIDLLIDELSLEDEQQ